MAEIYHKQFAIENVSHFLSVVCSSYTSIEIFPALCLFNSLFYFRFIRLNIIYGIFASYGVKYTVHNNGAPNWYYDFFIPICIHEHIQYVFSINTNQFTEHRRTLSIPINSTLSCLLKSFSCLLLAVIWTFAAGC